MTKHTRAALGASVALAVLASAGQAHAQAFGTPTAPTTGLPQGDAIMSEQGGANGGEILVTARRRDETTIAVPVAVVAIGGAELERRAINTIDSLARAVPSLITSEATSSPQGGIVAIRGLSGVDANPFGDQAVSFNIDGVQVARSSVRRLGQMDVSQIEVLKGPQALFFGKNSPAGIISMRTNDPTNTFRAQLSSGYEFNADETRTEGYISTPITDTLGIRVAGFYDSLKGYVRYVGEDSGAGVMRPFDRRNPNGDEYAVRGTVRWVPSDRFDARLKVTYSELNASGSTDNLQHLACPTGTPQTSFNPPENCRADDRTTSSDNIGPNFGRFDSRFGNGETYLHTQQLLAGLEANYKVADTLTLSSITGYYDSGNGYVGNFTGIYRETQVVPRTFLVAFANLNIREFSQELRLASDFDGPINFLFGGFYQDSKADVAGLVAFNALNPQFRSDYTYAQSGTAYSVFGQTLVKFVPQLELSIGARYSAENKRLTDFRTATAANRNLIGVDIDRNLSFNNLSPEFTLSYRPTDRFTVYGSYKEGFLSGGFNATVPAVSTLSPTTGLYTSLTDPAYQQQLIQGFEGGMKAALFDNTLRLNLAAYTYRTQGLQVAVLVGIQQELRNAGEVRTKGIEFDATYRTPIAGLSLTGAVAYLDGRYTDYQAQCYRGLAAPQCRTQRNRFTGATALLNDLSGTELVRAPDWSGNAGFDYRSPAFSGLKIGVNGNMNFSDSFFTDVVSAPGGRQGSYQLYDAGVRVMDATDRWELALIGRNLTDEYYFTRSADNPFTGAAPGGVSSLRGDTVGVPSRGREIWLRATVRFGR